MSQDGQLRCGCCWLPQVMWQRCSQSDPPDSGLCCRLVVLREEDKRQSALTPSLISRRPRPLRRPHVPLSLPRAQHHHQPPSVTQPLPAAISLAVNSTRPSLLVLKTAASPRSKTCTRSRLVSRGSPCRVPPSHTHSFSNGCVTAGSFDSSYRK